MASKLRKRLYDNREVGELARDTSDALAALVPSQIVRVTDIYAEPMTIAYDHEPAGVLLIRLQGDADPETPVAAWAPVSFTYTSTGVRIDAIEGPTLGEKYRFTFWVVG